MITTLDKYVPFKRVSDNDLVKARLFNKCRLSDTGCWVWTGPTRNKYGVFYVGNKDRSAHRISYEAFIGPVPKGLHLLHSCDNPGCINPAHLRPGTAKENAGDRQSRGRGRDSRGELTGTSKLTAENVIAIRASDKSPAELATEFGVSKQRIWHVRQGKSWAHLPLGDISKKFWSSKLDDTQRTEIVSAPESISNIELAKKYGVADSSICRIRGRRFKQTAPSLE